MEVVTQRKIDVAAAAVRANPKLFQRIMDKIAMPAEGDTDSCWLWNAAFVAPCTPAVSVRLEKRVHRAIHVRGLLFRLYAKQPIKNRLRPLCETGRCVNPWHVDNKHPVAGVLRARPSMRPIRLIPSSEARSCPRGHPILGRNQYRVNSHSPYVYCRICTYRGIERIQGTSLARTIAKIEADIARLVQERKGPL